MKSFALYSFIFCLTLSGFAKDKPTIAMISGKESPAWLDLFFHQNSSNLEAEFTILDRTQIDTLLKEKKLSISQLVSNPILQGKLLGCLCHSYQV